MPGSKRSVAVRKPLFPAPKWRAGLYTQIRKLLSGTSTREIAQRIGLGCLVWTVDAGLASACPSLLHVSLLYGVNALFSLVVIGAIVWIVFGALVSPFIGKEGRKHFRASSVEICLRAAGWLAKKILVSLVYTAFFVLKLTVAPVWPGTVADLVRAAWRNYTAQMRSVATLKIA